MPRLNVRWAAFFAALTATLLALVCVVGYESFKKGTRIRINSVDTTALDAYGVDVNSDNVINQFTNWTQELALAIAVTVESFDPNKAGTVVRAWVPFLDYLPINNLVAGNATLLAPAVPVRLPPPIPDVQLCHGDDHAPPNGLANPNSSSVTLGNSAGVMDASVHTVQCERSCEQSMMMCTHRFAGLRSSSLIYADEVTRS
ncbi:hypothetical protein B0H14DRAFT_3873363 [Mycena olivaceomarginata]|nr:hypothetical protein B0H14DRAFT_3873363 [Mycena olivaceomarginata]